MSNWREWLPGVLALLAIIGYAIGLAALFWLAYGRRR